LELGNSSFTIFGSSFSNLQHEKLNPQDLGPTYGALKVRPYDQINE
jgi:hypothetical protein